MRYKSVKREKLLLPVSPRKAAVLDGELISYEEWNYGKGRFERIVEPKVVFKNNLFQEKRRNSNGTFEIEEVTIGGNGKRYMLGEDDWNGENYFNCYELDKDGEVIMGKTYDFYPVYLERENDDFELLGYYEGI